MSFWGELKRRDVFKVAVAYLVASWLIVQVVGVLTPPLGLPDVLDTVIVVLLGIGFPFALIVAWIYDVTPHGFEVASATGGEARMPRQPGKRLTYVVTGLLLIAVSLTAIDKFLLTPSSTEFGTGSRLAVLPCDDLSPDSTNSFFAPGIHEELLSRLAALDALEVTSRTSVLQYATRRPPIPEIAAELDVDAVIECSVRYAGDRVLLTVQLIDGASDAHLWSESYPADMSELQTLFDIQAALAMDVANALHVTFLDDERERIERAPTESREAYELYLAHMAMNELERGTDRGIQFLDDALSIDDTFAEAWSAKSGAHFTRTFGVPLEAAATESELSLEAAIRATELDSESDLRAGAAMIPGVLYLRGQWIETENSYRQLALEQDRNPVEIGGYGPFKMAVGHLERARDALQEQLAQDPLGFVAAGLLMMTYDLLDDSAARQQAFERGQTLYPGWSQSLDVLLLRMGERDVAGLRGLPTGLVNETAMLHLADPAAGIQALRRLPELSEFIGNSVQYFSMSAWAAYFGDSELALEWLTASTIAVPSNFSRVWYPVFDSVRSEPGFSRLVSDLELPEYWDQFGWPPSCDRLDDGRVDCR